MTVILRQQPLYDAHSCTVPLLALLYVCAQNVSTPSPTSLAVTCSTKYVSVAYGSRGTVAVLPLAFSEFNAKQEQSYMLSAHGGDITDLQFNPFNESQLATASSDGVVKVWNVDGSNIPQSTAAVKVEGNSGFIAMLSAKLMLCTLLTPASTIVPRSCFIQVSTW